MFSSSSLLLAAAIVGIHSFTFAAASDAEAPVITPAPTPTIEKRQVAGGPGTPILSTLTYAYTDLPYQVYPFAVLRGPQFGFNQCNSTTLGPNSNCQTLIFNSPDDFCLWGSPTADGTIGDVEAKVVAYCTKPYHGTRLIAPGAITGLQWTTTPGYIQAVGFINNTGIGLDPTDEGGELDPHGADLQGNPLGGVVFSNGTADAAGGPTMIQVHNWNTFVGGGQFCFKACYNSITEPDYCLNIYDLIGCDYNMPSAAQDGEFTVCDGDVQEVVGVYTSGGQTLTWSMPNPLDGPPPYTPVIPASSNCQTFQSSDLFLAATGAASSSGTSATATGASASAATGSSGGSASSSKTGSGAPASSTGGSSSTSAAMSIRVPSGFFGLGLLAMLGAFLL